MSDDDLSDLSSLSSLSPAPSDDESDIQLRPEKGILKFFHKVPKPKTTIKLTNKGKATTTAVSAASSKKGKKKKAVDKGGDKQDDSDDSDARASKREREPSPPHEYVLADNPDIAFIVLFRNRFAEAFNKNMVNFGPQELERDIVDSVPSERVEYFLCALLKLLLNRQQDVKPGHYHRALDEAVQSHKSQWLTSWKENPLADGKTFQTMTPAERLSLLRALVLWATSSSKTIRDIIEQAYKGKRKDEDANVPVSVQSWGNDSDKRRYYLVEGRDDTAFRVYRESNPAGLTNRTWWSVAGSIDELKELIERLETKDGGPRARKLAKRLTDEIPRFEATEEKRRRREYRQQQRDRFKRPEPGFSLYEGRTRGKRIKYTYSDDEDFYTDSTDLRRSARHTGTHTPAEPVVTASGRQVRAPSRLNGGGLSATASIQGDSALDADAEATTGGEERELSLGPTGRSRRSAAVNHSMNGWTKKQSRADEYDEYDSQAEEEEEEGSEPDLGDDEDDADERVPEEEEEDEEEFDEGKDAMQLDAEEAAEIADTSNGSVVVKLPVKAVLDQETGKWGKGGTGTEPADTATSTQRLSGASTPINGNSKDHDDGDGDVTMTGSIAQSSDATATSPIVQHVESESKEEPLVDKPVDLNGMPPEGSAKEPAPPATPGKENGAQVPVTAAALAYRDSPEKTHQAQRPLDVVGH
ncbi:hypothetical protein SEUCBS140593_001757 [Sporothrix eucalyptigena]|uniref:WHIM1 domain-containing protein n=1 Tax=Sporothrix eucalyptigena TaxID=1812306 RepID=A0ABP0B0Z8_9PEZI